MGVPQLKSKKKNFRSNEYVFASEAIDNISDDIYEYRTALLRGNNEGMLAQIFKAKKNRSEESCLCALKELILMCLDDNDIMNYVFNAPAPTA